MKSLATAILLATIAVSAAAQNIWVGTFSGYLSQHGAAVYNKPVVQAELNWKLPRGAYVDLWLDESLDRKNNEVDYTLGWTNGSVDVSAAYYDLNPVGKAGDLLTSQLQLNGVREFRGNPVTLFASANYHLPRENPGENSGFWLRGGFSRARPLAKGLAFNETAWVMYDSGIFRGPHGGTLRYEAGVSFARAGYSVQPLLRVSIPVLMTGRSREIVFGVKVSSSLRQRMSPRIWERNVYEGTPISGHH